MIDDNAFKHCVFACVRMTLIMCYCILYYGVGKLKFKISVPVSACTHVCTCTNTYVYGRCVYLQDRWKPTSTDLCCDDNPGWVCTGRTQQTQAHWDTGTLSTNGNWEAQQSHRNTCTVQHLRTGMLAHYPHAQQAQRGSHVQHLRTGRPQVVPQQQVNTAGCPQMIQPTVTYLRNTLKHITFAYIWTRLYVHKV